MENIAVLSHADDIDGIGSAALVKMKYQVDTKKLFFISHIDADIAYAASQMKRLSRKGFTLFVTDLDPSGHTRKLYEDIVKGVNKNGGKVIWFAHHSWDRFSVDNIANKC